jgi:hypothetical protein
MHKDETNLPNEDYLIDYGFFKRVYTLEELLDESNKLPQQLAVWRNNFYHHFIVLEQYYEDSKSIKLTVVHKINKKPLKLAGNLKFEKTVVVKWNLLPVFVFHLKATILSILEADCITRVAIKEIKIFKKNGKYTLKNGKSLLDFASGVYLLGNYDEATREKAKKRALEAVSCHELYSGKSYNCEHFSNWCFIEKPVSYQSEKLSLMSQVADAGLNSCKSVPSLAVTGLIRQSAAVTTSRMVGFAMQPAKFGGLGVAIQVPIEAVTLTYSSLKMKEAVKIGTMTQENMNREVTKNVFGSAGSIAAGFGGSVAGKIDSYLIYVYVYVMNVA